MLPFGANPQTHQPAPVATGGALQRALEGLRFAVHQRAFRALAIAFAICGATTNGLIGIHFIPSAHDHGMPTTTAAGLLAAVVVFDIVGTIASGWVFAAHQVGAAIAALAAGIIRDTFGLRLRILGRRRALHHRGRHVDAHETGTAQGGPHRRVASCTSPMSSSRMSSRNSAPVV